MDDIEITPEMAQLWLQQLDGFRTITELEDQLTAEKLEFHNRAVRLRMLIDRIKTMRGQLGASPS